MSGSGTTRNELTAGTKSAFVRSPDSARGARYVAVVPIAGVRRELSAGGHGPAGRICLSACRGIPRQRGHGSRSRGDGIDGASPRSERAAQQDADRRDHQCRCPDPRSDGVIGGCAAVNRKRRNRGDQHRGGTEGKRRRRRVARSRDERMARARRPTDSRGSRIFHCIWRGSDDLCLAGWRSSIGVPNSNESRHGFGGTHGRKSR